MQFARLSVFAALLSSSTLLYAAPQYSLSVLGTLDGYSFSYPGSINNAGVVTGQSYTYNPEDPEARITASAGNTWNNGVVTALSGHGSPNSQAFSTNLHGSTVGTSWTVSVSLPIHGLPFITQPYDGQATLWSNGSATKLPGLYNEYGHASGINNSGQVVGWSLQDQFNTVATLWNNNNPTALAALVGYTADAYSINDQGKIAGIVRGENFTTHAVYWNSQNEIFLLQGISNGGSEAYALNEAGDLVGWSNSTDGHQHATVWVDGQAVDLGRLGGYASYAYGLNNLGDVVGSYIDDRPGLWGEYAVIWKNGVATNLNSLVDLPSGVELVSAGDINDDGYIIARGYDSEGRWVNYLLSPVPEPSSYALMLAGLGLLATRRRKQ